MRAMPDPRLLPDQVAVRMLRAGLCGTDVEIGHGLFGRAPAGEEFLILGHENLGIVEDVGKRVTGWKPGDFVVATVRRPCGACEACARGESDMCTTGRYEERGIMRRHGFLAEYYVELPRWLIRIPKAAADVAVLLEPISIVQKAVERSFALQAGLRRKPKIALVLGAGPIGLLATALLRLRNLETYIVSREPADDEGARIGTRLGATYVSVANKALPDVQRELPPVDLAIEATGSASVAFDAIHLLGRSGVLCLLSSTAGKTTRDVPIDAINQKLVLENSIVFGSVNSNLRHFKQGVKDIAAIQRKFPGVLDRLITERLPWTDYRQWFDRRRTGIKTTLEFGN
jgi:threonine dehydrogenase-like Zn-dependent dehydrogenase